MNRLGNKMKNTQKNTLVNIICTALLIVCVGGLLEIPQRILNKNTLTIGVFSDSFWDVQNGYSYKILDDAIEMMKSNYPDISVHYESGILKEDYSEWLSEKLISKDAPDVFMVLPDDFNDLISVGALQELSGIIAEDQTFHTDRYFTSAFNSAKYNGEQYALPYECAPQLMFINKTILDKEGIPLPKDDWTWDDFLSICEKVTKDLDGDGRIDQFGTVGYTWKEAFDSNDVHLFNEVGTQCYFSSENVAEAITFLEKLKNINQDYAPSEKDFDKGNVVFKPMSFAEYRAYNTYPLSVKKYSGFEWECISMPAGPSGKNVSRLKTLFIAINKDSKNIDNAWKLMKQLTYDPKIQSEIFQYSEGVSVLKEVTESDETMNRLMNSFGNNIFNLQILTNTLEQSVVLPKFRDEEQANAEVDKAVNAIISGDGNISMEQIIWNRALNKFLNK